MSHFVVHKYGSSVLSDEEQLGAVVDSIYGSVRQGERVVVVVSAMGDTTDILLNEARRFGEDVDANALATFLSTGELRSASLLTFALGRAGIAAAMMDAGAIELRTDGDVLDAEPLSVNAEAIEGVLRSASVLVVPGFVGRGREGQTTLLGRGGSDLTALFIAAELGARCVLYKDVDGIYEADPNRTAGLVRRYVTMSWQAARDVGGKVIQDKAVSFAEARALDFTVQSLGKSGGTRIGRFSNELTSHEDTLRPLKVVLLGLGTVGLGVYRRLREQPDSFEVVSIAVRDADKERPTDIAAELLTTDAVEAVGVNHDITVEVMGGLEAARAGIEFSLRAGRLVVTANKDLVAEAGEYLEELAYKAGGKLVYGAAVGGAVPCVEAVERLVKSEELSSVTGVLNGTTNFVLNAMERGEDFSSALKQAQEAGFAEADPTADIEGVDAARKLVILMRRAFGAGHQLEDIRCEGIGSVTAEDVQAAQGRGEVIRLVARCEQGKTGIRATVGPECLSSEHPLAQVGAAGNAIEICTSKGVIERWSGSGAGRWPTAQAVVGDILSEVPKRVWQEGLRVQVA